MTYNFGCGHRQIEDEKSCLKGCRMAHGRIGYFNYQTRTARFSRVAASTDTNKAQAKRSAQNRRERKLLRGATTRPIA